LIFQRRNKANAEEVVIHLITFSGTPKTTMILGRRSIPDALRDIPASIKWENKPSPFSEKISPDRAFPPLRPG